MDKPTMWSDWAGIMAETLRQVIESNSHPRALEIAAYNLSVYDAQRKAVREFEETADGRL